MTFTICLLWATLALPATCLSQTLPDILSTPDRQPSDGAARAEIPFKLYQDYLIVVQGSLGSLEGLNFLIDTGANASSIGRRIAKKLQLAGEADKLFLFNQKVEVARVILPSLQLGPLRVEFLPGLIQDLSPVEKALGVRIDAIVGFDVLARSSFIVDYESKKMLFGPLEPSTLAVPFDAGSPTPGVTVQLRIQGQPVRLLVDTGAAQLLFYECNLPPNLHVLPTQSVKHSFNSAMTQFDAEEVRVAEVRLGASDFGVEKSFLLNDHASCRQPISGVLGVRSLGLKWVAFDFERRRFGWRK
jgi:hypothetical protein